MKKNKLFISIIFVLIAALLILIMQENSTTTSEASHQISVIVSDSNSARWTRFRAGLEQAAKDYNVNLNYVTTTKLDDMEQEKSAIDKEIDNGTDAIIVQLVDNVTAHDYITERSKNATIALVETDLEQSNTSKSYSVTQADNQGIGTALGQLVSSDTNNDSVGIVTGDSAAVSMRFEALQKAFEDKNVKISWTVQTSEEAVLKQIGSPAAAIVTLDNETLEEIAEDYKDTKGKVKIYGVGCSDKSINYLDSSKIAGMIVPNEYTMGYVSLSKVAIFLNNRMSKIVDTTVNYFTVTKENLYSTENQKMIFPIVG